MSASTENLIFGLVLAALLIVLIVLVVMLRRSRESASRGAGTSAPGSGTHPVHTPDGPEKKKTEAPKKPVELMGSLAKSKAVPADPTRVHVDVRDRKTIDEHYAASHGQWRCPYCETLNGDDLSICAACGQPRG